MYILNNNYAGFESWSVGVRGWYSYMYVVMLVYTTVLKLQSWTAVEVSSLHACMCSTISEGGWLWCSAACLILDLELLKIEMLIPLPPKRYMYIHNVKPMCIYVHVHVYVITMFTNDTAAVHMHTCVTYRHYCYMTTCTLKPVYIYYWRVQILVLTVNIGGFGKC